MTARPQRGLSQPAGLTPFFVATVLLRDSVPVFLLGFVAAGWFTWPLLPRGA